MMAQDGGVAPRLQLGVGWRCSFGGRLMETQWPIWGSRPDILHPLNSDNRLYPDQVDYMQRLEQWLNAPQAPSEDMSLWRRALRLISRWRR